jgi:hypothetical protein
MSVTAVISAIRLASPARDQDRVSEETLANPFYFAHLLGEGQKP